MQTRAAVLRRSGMASPYEGSRPLTVEVVELAEAGPGEVLVKIEAAGLCHSDLSVINGDRPRPLPMALGHEASGIVEAVGPGVTTVAVGDRVVTTFVPSCGACLMCRQARPALCEPAAQANNAGTLLSGARRITDSAGLELHHHLGSSVFAERAVVSANSVVRVDPDLASEHAALFGCAVLTGVGAVINTGALRAGQTVTIVGLGGVGLAALLGAVAAGAREIVAIDPQAHKLELARRLGATHTMASGDDAAIAVRDLTEGGTDLAIETAGVIPALECAYQSTRRGGTTVTASLPHPASRWPISPVELVAQERTIKGSYIGSAVPQRDIPRYIGLFQAGRLPVDQMLGDQFALSDINAALDSLASGAALRQVINVDE